MNAVRTWQGDVVSLVEAFRNGGRSPVDEVRATLAAIQSSDLNAFSFVDAEGALKRAEAADVVHGPAWAFRLGLATNLANPKTAAFVASLFAAAMPPDPAWWQGLAAVALMLTISSIWYTIVVFSLTHRAVANAYRAARRGVDAATGALFVAFGAAMATSVR